MKKQVSRQIFLLGVAALLIAGCGNPGKKQKGVAPDGRMASVEVEVFDPVKIKDQIIEVIQKSPKGPELVDMLNEAGASYILDLTVPVESSEKFLAQTLKSIGLGMYGFDLKYAAVYNRSDVALQLRALSENLMADLGISSELNVAQKFGNRITANKESKDSLNYLVSEMLNEYHRQMALSDHVGAYTLSVIGGNIEALYILSQMALLARDNTKFLALLSNQQERVKSLDQLLELMSGDESVAPYYESMKPVFAFFEAHPTIGNEQLKQVAPDIEKVRNSMVQ